MKILISACLLGEDVRYDGKNSAITLNTTSTFYEKELFMDILSEHTIYSFCPEVSGGLPVPRSPAEIINPNKPFEIRTNSHEDVTLNFLIGARDAFELCTNEEITVALFKSKSPSCGNNGIYDGTFSGNLIPGVGLTTKLLQENGVTVFNENQIKELAKFLNPKLEIKSANSFEKLCFNI